MRKLAIALLLIGALAPTAAADPGAAREGRSPVLALLTYLPDRVLDLLDVARLRARAGPGMALGLRATEGADLFLGSYTAVFVGLPGPRGSALVRLPAGVESRTGAEVSVADLSTGAGLAPSFGAAEVGAGFQIFLLGIEVGVDPLELADAVTGFFGVDLVGDDF